MGCFDDESEVLCWRIDSVLPEGYYVIETYVPDMYPTTNIYRECRLWLLNIRVPRFFDKVVAEVDGNSIAFSDRKAFAEFGDRLREKGFEVSLL